MPQNDINSKLAAAKSTLAKVNKDFPPRPTAPAPAKPAAPPAKPATLGDELLAKQKLVNKAVAVLPKLHSGGPVPADGAYELKAGEHVLTASEAARARKHALIHAGMKSLAQRAQRPQDGAPEAPAKPAAPAKPEKKAAVVVKGKSDPNKKISLKK